MAAAGCEVLGGGGSTPAAVPAAVVGVVAVVHVSAVVAMAGRNLSTQMKGGGSGGGGNPAQNKLLTKGETKKLKEAGIDPHELKDGKGTSKCDLRKDQSGNVYVKRKGGNGPEQETGLNLNKLSE